MRKTPGIQRSRGTCKKSKHTNIVREREGETDRQTHLARPFLRLSYERNSFVRCSRNKNVDQAIDSTVLSPLAKFLVL